MAKDQTLPSAEVIATTVAALSEHGFLTEVVEDRAAALEAIKKLIPAGAEVMTGSSTTLEEIGFSEYLNSGTHPWTSVYGQITAEDDAAKRADLRRKAVTAEYFVASANAVTQEGALIAVDMTGSRVGAFLFAAKNLVLVIGAQKITENLEAGLRRVREVVFPLEDERAFKAYGAHSMTAKWAIMEHEAIPNRVHVIMVKEALGF